jgi:hypothetical protein
MYNDVSGRVYVVTMSVRRLLVRISFYLSLAVTAVTALAFLIGGYIGLRMIVEGAGKGDLGGLCAVFLGIIFLLLALIPLAGCAVVALVTIAFRRGGWHGSTRWTIAGVAVGLVLGVVPTLLMLIRGVPLPYWPMPLVIAAVCMPALAGLFLPQGGNDPDDAIDQTVR